MDVMSVFKSFVVVFVANLPSAIWLSNILVKCTLWGMSQTNVLNSNIPTVLIQMHDTKNN